MTHRNRVTLESIVTNADFTLEELETAYRKKMGDSFAGTEAFKEYVEEMVKIGAIKQVGSKYRI